MSEHDTQRPTLHSAEAEQSVIGGLLLDNDAIDRIGDLRAEHFYRADHRAIFEQVTAMIAGGGADVVTTFAALQAKGKAEQVGGLVYLNALAQNTPSAANIARYAAIVRDRAQKRGLLTVAAEIQDTIGSTPDDAATLIDRAASKLEALSDGVVKREPKPVAQGLAEHLAELERRSSGTSPAFSTGFPDLDRRLNGGLRPGWLAILAARPGMGKTALALNIAAHAAESRSVLFLSMEMPDAELHDRLIASLGRTPLARVMEAPADDNEFWGRVTVAAQKVTGLNLHIDDQAALRLQDVRAKARMVKRKHGLDLIVVDYLQLMAGDGANRNAEIEGISRELKALAKELGVAILCLAQLNRRVEDRGGMPKLSDLRDSGAIEQDADAVLFIHREEVSNPDAGEQWHGFAQVRIAKFRHGGTGDLALTYRGEFVTFESHAGPWPTQPASRPARSRGFD
ncbi:MULTISPECIES: replicative DNA helicase [unclassified Burkholderia]|uniref:replicative DNA helicase n=1 Tax=unclassified Burkholderia TaxID=2613784 RepID=UPI000F5AA309|nr:MULTISPECIES: replicative DNA helicase [unclassified Burkholderia]RQS22865.1 replicative DNA helicase [Burkholderia sp. Bp8995]RQS42875.1 replicative DNA helicase [Burkholderia sp. Bp8989]